MKYDWLKNDEDAIIYVGDAMCSWCYGIAPELKKLKEDNPKLNFHLIMGGLRPFNTEKAIDMADFLKGHWVEIEERTGQVFNYDILKEEDFIYDTEPASRAVVVARNMNPEIEFAFFEAVQVSFYRDNKRTDDLNTYIQLAKAFDLDEAEFERLFLSTDIKENTKADFQISQEMGIKGFPSVVYKKGKEFSLVANGYQTAENIQKIITKIG